MQEYVNMSIDGAKVRAVRGASVLDVALEYGFCIPHLCHIPGIKPFGACRLCIVELVRDGRSKITASCTLDAAEGMVVLTSTEKVVRLRKNIAEMLVAEAPNSKAVQDVAARCGVNVVRYGFRNNDCVLCGRCVRVCEDVWQARALGFVGRGGQRHVDFPFGRRPDFCKECRSCIDLCPMTIAPCNGVMKAGEEKLCAQCQSQLLMAETMPATCVRCELGKGFQCSRQSRS